MACTDVHPPFLSTLVVHRTRGGPAQSFGSQPNQLNRGLVIPIFPRRNQRLKRFFVPIRTKNDATSKKALLGDGKQSVSMGSGPSVTAGVVGSPHQHSPNQRSHDATSTVQVVCKPKGSLNGVLNGDRWPFLAVLDFDVSGILAGPLNGAVWVGQMSALPQLQVHVIR